jgi:hypothetical protein
MKRHLLLLTFLLITTISFCQKIIYSGNGNIIDGQSNKLKPAEVEALLKDNEVLLRSYIAGRSKKSVGNVMLYGGLGLIVTDLAIGAFSDTEYPTFFTIVGGITTLIAIPVKLGYQKKIKNVVDEYNASIGFSEPRKIDPQLHIVPSTNGLCMRLTFN